MTILNAAALNSDPRGAERLRAVITTAPGYDERRAAAASRIFMLPPGLGRHRGGAAIGRRAVPSPALCER